MYFLINLLFYDIPLLYYYTNLNWPILFCLSSFCDSPKDFFECNSVEILVILFAILLSLRSPVASEVFWITHFEAVFIASVEDFLALSRSFWLYLLLRFLTTLAGCVSMFLAQDKNPYTFIYILSFGSVKYLIFIKLYYLIIKVNFILSPTSNDWLF